jgi:hypothetical protein
MPLRGDRDRDHRRARRTVLLPLRRLPGLARGSLCAGIGLPGRRSQGCAPSARLGGIGRRPPRRSAQSNQDVDRRRTRAATLEGENEDLRILLTNAYLSDRGGSELYIRDLAVRLRRRGHQPIAYSTFLGAVAADLRASAVPVIDDLTLLTDPPDVIHGQASS